MMGGSPGGLFGCLAIQSTRSTKRAAMMHPMAHKVCVSKMISLAGCIQA